MTTKHSSGPGASFNPVIAVSSPTYAAFRGASKDAFAADWEAAIELRRALDGVQVDEVIQENVTAFVRAVGFLTRKHLQLADLGGGRPMQGLDQCKLPDLCQVANERQPQRRWPPLDSDITVVIAGRALIGGPSVAVAQEDLRCPSEVVYAMDEHLHPGKQIVVIRGAVLHFLTTEEVHALMSELWASRPAAWWSRRISPAPMLIQRRRPLERRPARPSTASTSTPAPGTR
uniref:SAM-dependent methyltransferase n=1 Tax=Nonomuraea sp. CA-252377 TaxID=3240003 RepID=UPI003F493416